MRIAYSVERRVKKEEKKERKKVGAYCIRPDSI